MAKQYLMAIDAGTGSVRAVLFGIAGEQLGCVQREWTHGEDPRYPGSMDFDWKRNWQLASECVRGVLAATCVNPADIVAVSTTCMREGIVLYDAQGNEQVRPVLELGLTLDERIADGYYYAKTVKLVKHFLQNPELLERPAHEEVAL